MTQTVGLEEMTQTVGLEEMTQTVGLEKTTQQLQSLGLFEQAISVHVCAVCVEPKPSSSVAAPTHHGDGLLVVVTHLTLDLLNLSLDTWVPSLKLHGGH